MAIKCVLFDNDGVVVNSPEMFSEKLARQNHIPAKDIAPFFKKIFLPKIMIGKADLKKELKPWLKKWKWRGTVDELLQYWFESEHNINKLLIKHVLALKKNGVKCYLLTNQEKYRTKYLREEMEFAKIFDGIFSSSELGCKKPSPQFYKKIFSEINKNSKISKPEILYIDDDKICVTAGKKFGFNSALYVGVKKLKQKIK